jgi:hypothetical protein
MLAYEFGFLVTSTSGISWEIGWGRGRRGCSNPPPSPTGKALALLRIGGILNNFCEDDFALVSSSTTYSFLKERHSGFRMSVDSGNVHERASVSRPLVDGCLELLCQESHNA